MSVETLSRAEVADVQPAAPSARMSWRPLRHRYALLSAAGVIAAFASGDWRVALAVFGLTCLVLAALIGWEVARA